MVKAFLLAAGFGSRLRPLTDHTAKCLVNIQNTPLLQIWFELLEQHGVTEVLLNTHYHAKQVEKFASEYTGQLRVKTVYEPELLGSAGALRANRSFIDDDEPFLIAYADILTKLNISSMLQFYRQNPSLLVMGLFRAPVPENCGICQLDEHGTIYSFVEKPKRPVGNLANCGIYLANREFFSYLPENTPADLGFDVLPQLVGKMRGYIVDEYLTDIGTNESYQRAQEEWKDDRVSNTSAYQLHGRGN